MSSMLRSYRRNRAKVNMKTLDMRKICKHTVTGMLRHQLSVTPSIFSENWRKMSGGVIVKKKKEGK